MNFESLILIGVFGFGARKKYTNNRIKSCPVRYPISLPAVMCSLCIHQHYSHKFGLQCCKVSVSVLGGVRVAGFRFWRFCVLVMFWRRFSWEMEQTRRRLQNQCSRVGCYYMIEASRERFLQPAASEPATTQLFAAPAAANPAGKTKNHPSINWNIVVLQSTLPKIIYLCTNIHRHMG